MTFTFKNESETIIKEFPCAASIYFRCTKPPYNSRAIDFWWLENGEEYKFEMNGFEITLKPIENADIVEFLNSYSGNILAKISSNGLEVLIEK